MRASHWVIPSMAGNSWQVLYVAVHTAVAPCLPIDSIVRLMTVWRKMEDY